MDLCVVAGFIGRRAASPATAAVYVLPPLAGMHDGNVREAQPHNQQLFPCQVSRLVILPGPLLPKLSAGRCQVLESARRNLHDVNELREVR